MKINITVFKENGKYYTSHVVEDDKTIQIFNSNFDKFVYDNLPARLDTGYVVISNADPNSPDFYELLYKMEDLVSSV